MALIALMAVILSLLVNHFRPAGLPISGQFSRVSSSEGGEAVGQYVITIEEARALFLTNGAVFIDARSAEVYREGHIRGALNLPLDSLDEMLPDVMAQVPPDSIVITYCDGQNCPFSKDVALQLAAKGYPHVRILINGWTVWKEAGLPVEGSSKVTQ